MRRTESGLVVSAGMVDRVAELVAVAAVEDALGIAVMTGVVRVVSGSREVKVAMIGVVRVVMIGATVGVVRVVKSVAMNAVSGSVMIAMMPQNQRRSSDARRCSHARALVSTAKTSRLPTARIATNA